MRFDLDVLPDVIDIDTISNVFEEAYENWNSKNEEVA